MSESGLPAASRLRGLVYRTRVVVLDMVESLVSQRTGHPRGLECGEVVRRPLVVSRRNKVVVDGEELEPSEAIARAMDLYGCARSAARWATESDRVQNDLRKALADLPLPDDA
jgi:hypothetical protein